MKFFAPGPSQLYPTVGKHMQTALNSQILSISHRSPQYQEIHKQTILNLKKLLNIPKNYQVFFLNSATEAMERVISNCVQKAALHMVNGAFSRRFFETSLALGKQSQSYEIDWGTGFTKQHIISYPLSYTHYNLICFTHNETSTGVQLDLNIVYQLKQKYPEILIAIDVVSSVPDVELDFKYLDCVFFSVQKGFGMPAGLGVLVVSPQALEVGLSVGTPPSVRPKIATDSKHGRSSGIAPTISSAAYHSFPSLLKYAQKNQTPETPNVLAIYLLGQVAQDMLDYGIDNIRADTSIKANLIYDFFDHHSTFKPYISKPDWRSRTTIPIVVSPPEWNTTEKSPSKSIIDYLSKQGFLVGSGYGKLKPNQIRIANFPSHSLEEIQQLTYTISKRLTKS